MTYSDDDRPLVDFLRRYRSSVPPAPGDLEDRILAQITDARTQSMSAPTHRRQRPRYWAIPAAIAAGLVATVIGYQTLAPKPASEADETKLEAFIESNWDGTVSSSVTDYDVLFNDTTPVQ